MGIGLGMTIAALLLFFFSPGRMSDFQIEQKAREMGMVYKNEIVIIRENATEGAATGEIIETDSGARNQTGD